MIQFVVIEIISYWQEYVQHLSLAFSWKDEYRYSTRRQHDQTRPWLSLKMPPHDHFVVINDWVFNLILQNSCPNFFSTFFVYKFCRVTSHENHRLFTSEFLFKEFYVRNYMQAVDAAISPEINQGYFTHQIFNWDGSRVEPIMIWWKFFCLHLLLLFQRCWFNHTKVISYAI